MDLLVTDEVKPTHLLWQIVTDELHASIELAKDGWQSQEGHAVLSSRMKDLEKSEGEYLSAWKAHLTQLISCDVTVDLFLKEHTKIKAEISQAKTLLGQAIDSLTSRQNFKTDPHLKLPEIKLPEFHGDHTEWAQFWDLFSSLVDTRTDIPVSVKFTYLKNCLKGSSSKLIAGFHVTEANYLEAKDLLMKTYKEDKRISRKLVKQLLDIKAPNHNHRELLEFKMKYDQILRSLKAYQDVQSSDWLVLEILLNKLNTETQTFLYNHHKTQYFSFQDFDSSLENLIKLLESTKSNCKAPEHASKVTKGETPQKSSVTWQATASKSNFVCSFCSQGHYSNRCPTYPSLESRKTALMKEHRCLRCGYKGHYVSDCNVSLLCYLCKGNHWTPLCPGASTAKLKYDTSGTGKKSVAKKLSYSGESLKPVNAGKPESLINLEQKKGTNKTAGALTPTVNKGVTTGVDKDRGGGVALPTALLSVKTRTDGKINDRIRCFFDSGAQKSFIHPNVVNNFGLKPCGKVTISLSAFGHGMEQVQCPVVKLKLGLGSKVFSVPFLVTDKVGMKLSATGLSQTVKMLKGKGLRLADGQAKDHLSDVSAVIGADYMAKFIRGIHRIEGVNLFNSTGGYIIFGPLPYGRLDDRIGQHSAFVSRITVNDTEVDPCQIQIASEPPVHQLWELEAIGIKDEKLTPGERSAVETFSKTIIYSNNQYWVTLPWKRESFELATNFRMAMGQLRSLHQHLGKDAIKFGHYKKVLDEYIQNDFIEEVKDPYVTGHYLPHHAVLKDSVTTPLRVVFNASAKARSNNLSLNDALETGPSLTEKLVDTLLNFRTGKFALVADISKAFLRIGLQEADRDYVRFLWSDEPTSAPRTYRFKAVPFGLTSSPFLLQATLYKHFETFASDKRLGSFFYVDNFQCNVQEVSELFQIYAEVTECLSKAKMPLQQWNSNSEEFNLSLGDPERKVCQAVLGVQWDTETDALYIKALDVSKFESLTKRQALSTCSQVYDPLGLLSPITVKSKLFIQDLWKSQVGWDDRLGDDVVHRFNYIVSEYSKLHLIKFPRSLCCKHDATVLHVFCDASTQAYGAAAYLSNKQDSGLLMSRCRVAPVKTKSIPQLELTAVVVGCRLAKYICTVLQRQFTVFVWSDNLPCLQWILGNQSNIVYVKNRVGEILTLQKEIKFSLHHVGSKENPADLLSRGSDIKTLISSEMWLRGPKWLCFPENWPDTPIQVKVSEILTQDVPILHFESIFPVDRFSSLRKLLNVTNCVIRFINNCSHNKYSHLNSEHYWLKHQQIQHYPLVYEALALDSYENKYYSSRRFITDLNLFLDDKKIIRSKGRLNERVSLDRSNNPKLLPPKSFLCRLIVENLHKVNHHVGVQGTLDSVRDEFWIPQGRQCVKKIVNSCVICKYNVRKAFKYPGPPPLPIQRTTYSRPFQNCGVDFTGAIKLNDVSGETSKYYICLFTCAATRAVHLELINSLSAESFLLCLRRFVARCSLPDSFVSDNATNFVAINKFLSFLQDDEVIQNYLCGHKIRWHFISPRAPWQGGMYERMIGIVKDALHKALHGRKVHVDELITLLCEVEAVVNNRPLTYLDDDVNNEILTPAHLLYGRKISLYPFYEKEDISLDFDCNLDVLLEFNNHLNFVINKFKSLFYNSYLKTLREKHYLSHGSPSRTPMEGDIVILGIDQPKGIWHLGKIVKLIPSNDNLVREVEVLSRGTVSRRTVEKLIPLELNVTIEDNNGNCETCVDSDPVLDDEEPRTPVRPRRRAAEKAHSLIQNLVNRHLL